MDLFSVLGGIDNLRKFLVVAGIFLLAFGFLYPLQISLELKEKKIKQQELDTLALINIKSLEKDVETLNTLYNFNTIRFDSLKLERDSLKNLKLNEEVIFRITSIETKIKEIITNEKSSVKELKLNSRQIDKDLIKRETLKKEIEVTESFIKKYNWYMIISMILGGILMISGFIGWRKSQRQSDELKQLQIDAMKNNPSE